MTGAPIVFTYHTKFEVEFERAVKSRAVQNTLVKGMIGFISLSDEVWTVSKGAGESLKELGYKGEYKVIPNGVDFPKGRADQQLIDRINEEYDLPADVPLYLFVGRIFEYKGLPIILDALKILHDQNRDFRMVFIGDGADREATQEHIDSFGIQDKVKMIGKVTDRELLRAWYSRADLFLFPSTYDTNGIVVHEAAACATPSALIADSCAAEGISDKHNGFLISENKDDLARLLLNEGSDLEKLKEVGKNAMNEICLSWNDAVSIARQNYLHIINKPK